MRLRLSSRRATRNLGRALAALLQPGDIVWLEGELGAGKTFFTRGLFRALGVPEAVPVTSPTFALVHEHQGRCALVHMDLYRLGAVEELDELGIHDALESSIAVIEWGARYRSAIAKRGVEIALAIPEWPTGRVAVIRGLDARGQDIVAGLARVPRLG